MKVVQINAVYGYGSTGLIVKDLEKALLKTNNQSFVAYQKAKGKPENGVVVGSKADWKMHALLTRVFGRQGYFSNTATKKLIKTLKEEKPDIVHLHNLHSNYINVQKLLKYLAKENIPTVITLHDCWFFTGKCFHFTALGCNKWQKRCGKCPQNKSDVKSWFFDATSKVFDDRLKYIRDIKNLTVVGCSDWICDLAKKSPIFKGKSIERIYNGVDTDVFKRKDREKLRCEYGVSDKFVIMGMANKWLLEKNADVLNSIISTLTKDEILMLVGCSDEQKKKLSAYDGVVAMDFVADREELSDLYNMADVFVNLTFEDTLPTVNMEAICSSTPVITYDTCGSPELVIEGKTGYVIPVLDTDKLKKAIKDIKEGNVQRKDCEEMGKVSFDKNNQYLQYISLYEKICIN